MGRLGQRTSAALGLLAALAMAAVVATAPNDFPTPSDGIWGRTVPQPQDEISLALLTLAALLFGTTAALAARISQELGTLGVSVSAPSLLGVDTLPP